MRHSDRLSNKRLHIGPKSPTKLTKSLAPKTTISLSNVRHLLNCPITAKGA